LYTQLIHCVLYSFYLSDTPVCKHTDRVILIGASKDETVEVICEIQADPPPR